MSDKYLQLAERDVDAKLRKGKLEEQKYDTKLKHSDKLKDVMESQKTMIKPSTVRQVMFERLEEGMNTKIPADNKGYQLLLKLGFKEGGALGKPKATSQADGEQGLAGDRRIREPIGIEIKGNKHGIEYMDKGAARLLER